MNLAYLYTVPLLLTVGASLLFWLTHSQQPHSLYLFAGMVLVLPAVGLYILMLFVGGWLFVSLDFLASVARSEPGVRHSLDFSERPHHT